MASSSSSLEKQRGREIGTGWRHQILRPTELGDLREINTTLFFKMVCREIIFVYVHIKLSLRLLKKISIDRVTQSEGMSLRREAVEFI
jgi:hypothetical protein